MSFTKFQEGKNGLVKVGVVESPNIEGWTYAKSEQKTEIPVQNVTTTPSLTGTPSEGGQITAYFDPSDATHVAMFNSGIADLDLYMDGEASGDHFFDCDGVKFSNFNYTSSATEAASKFTVDWAAGAAGVTLTAVA